jgi:hypothetical protein
MVATHLAWEAGDACAEGSAADPLPKPIRVGEKFENSGGVRGYAHADFDDVGCHGRSLLATGKAKALMGLLF